MAHPHPADEETEAKEQAQGHRAAGAAGFLPIAGAVSHGPVSQENRLASHASESHKRCPLTWDVLSQPRVLGISVPRSTEDTAGRVGSSPRARDENTAARATEDEA